MQLKVIIEVLDGAEPCKIEVAVFERETLSNATCGLSMAEAKALLANVQQALVEAQAADHIAQHDTCPECGAAYSVKGNHSIVVRTLFGKLRLNSPRHRSCPCQQSSAPKKSFSPLVSALPERTTPEFRYLQCKWSALMSFGLTAQLMEDVLPLGKPISTAVLSRQVHRIAERSDGELGDEQAIFIEGCPQTWAGLPQPEPPLTIGIDGGYVHGREGKNRKASSFEVIVGKSMPEDGPVRRFGFVNGYDTKPKRRLFEVLQEQGMQANQQVIFLSDGGDTVRELQLYLNPQAEHLLDWFHVAMRLTVLGQLVKGLVAKPASKVASKKRQQDEVAETTSEEVTAALERVKWFLWHGNVFSALQVLQDIEFDLESLTSRSPEAQKLLKSLLEFRGYITANRSFIVNYGDRYRNGEIISSAFVESTVNELISKRFVKKQQMRWTKPGAHRMLQLRVQVLDGELQRNFERWYPNMHIDEELLPDAA